MLEDVFHFRSTISDILEESWSVFKKNFKTFFSIILICFVPSMIIRYLLLSDIFFERTYDIERLSTFINSIATLISYPALFLVAYHYINGNKINVKTAFSWAADKYMKIIGLSIMITLAAIIPIGAIVILLKNISDATASFIPLFIIVLIPIGVYLGVLFSFIFYAVITGNTNINDSFEHSSTLVKGKWWSVFGYLFVFGLMAFLAGALIGVLTWISPESIILELFSDFILEIIILYFYVVHVMFYVNLLSLKYKEEQFKANYDINAFITQQNSENSNQIEQ